MKIGAAAAVIFAASLFGRSRRKKEGSELINNRDNRIILVYRSIAYFECRVNAAAAAADDGETKQLFN